MTGVPRSNRWWLAFVFVVLSARAASAQVVLNPTTAEFLPSPDHAVLSDDGHPLVSSYVLGLYVVGTSTPFQSIPLGKPEPGTDGLIRVNFLSLLTSTPAAGITYEARVSAVGPGGTAESTTSNGFGFESVGCSYTLASSTYSAASTGGTGSVGVTAPAGCAWSTASNAGWISITGGASGSGTGATSFSVAPNTSTSPRSGTMSIAGQTFTVTQAAGSCTYAISPASQSFGAAGGTGSATVTSQAGCSWTGTSNASWIDVTGGASGSGAGATSFTVEANTSPSQRTGTMTIAGRTFTVTQDGASCTYAISPASQSFGAAGGTGTATVTSQAGCSWTATSNATWIDVTGGASGSGAGTTSFTVDANTSTSQRTGTMTIGGRTFTVTQAAASCTYAISPASQSFDADGGNGSTAMTALAGCAWTAASNAGWIEITGGASGAGNGTTSFTVAPNAGMSVRTGTMSIAGRTFTVTQAAASCSFAISPAAQTFGAAAGTGAITITAPAGCAWTATRSGTWITLTGTTSGTGSDTVEFSVAANTGTSQRTGTISAGGRTFTITQGGASCTTSISPLNRTVLSAGSASSVAVTAGSACSWTAVSNNSWLTITGGASGTGSGTVTFTAAANWSSSSRSGTLTVGGQTLNVSQGASACSATLSSTGATVQPAGGAGSFSLTATLNCGWAAVSSVDWITVTSSGSGSGTVSYRVAANQTSVSRSGTISVAGRTFTITQGAMAPPVPPRNFRIVR